MSTVWRTTLKKCLGSRALWNVLVCVMTCGRKSVWFIFLGRFASAFNAEVFNPSTLEASLHSFEVWLIPSQSLHHPLELLWLLMGQLGFADWQLGLPIFFYSDVILTIPFCNVKKTDPSSSPVIGAVKPRELVAIYCSVLFLWGFLAGSTKANFSWTYPLKY